MIEIKAKNRTKTNPFSTSLSKIKTRRRNMTRSWTQSWSLIIPKVRTQTKTRNRTKIYNLLLDFESVLDPRIEHSVKSEIPFPVFSTSPIPSSPCYLWESVQYSESKYTSIGNEFPHLLLSENLLIVLNLVPPLHD